MTIPTPPAPGTSNWGGAQNATDNAQTTAIQNVQAALTALAGGDPARDTLPEVNAIIDTLTGVVSANSAALSGGALPTKVASTTPATTSAAPAVQRLNLYDATSGNLAPSLPLANSVANGAVVGFKKTDATANLVTATCSGNDRIGSTTGSTSIPIRTLDQVTWLASDGVSVWSKVDGELSLPALDGRFASFANAVNPNDVGMDGVLAIGQSNNHGAASGFDQRTVPVDARVRVFGAANAPAPFALTDSAGVEPFGTLGPSYSIASIFGVGPNGFMLREYVKRAPVNRSGCVIQAAFGGTALRGPDSLGTRRNWRIDSPGTAGNDGSKQNLYEAAIAQATAFLTANPNNRIIAITWIQGEQDAANGNNGSTYQADFDPLINGVRSRLAALPLPNAPTSSVPFITGPMTPEAIAQTNTNFAAINAVHIDTPRRIQNTAFVYGPGRGFTDPVNGNLHWGLTGQQFIGAGFYAALARAKANVTGIAPVALTVAPVVTQTAASTATVRWVQSAQRATGYVVEVNTGSGWSTVTRAATLIDVTQALTGLSAGQNVQVRVSVVNEQGTSAPSPVGTLALGTPPAAPTIGTPTNINATSVDVPFTPPSGTLTGFTVYSSTDGTTWTYANTTSNPAATVITAPGLTPSTAYTFRVTASSIAGEGAQSASSSSVTTLAAATPFLVDQFTDTALTNLSAHTPNTGNAWSTVAGTLLISDQGRVRSSSGATSLYLNSTTPSSADTALTVDFNYLSLVTGASAGAYVRGSGTGTGNFNGYGVRYVVASSAWQLVKWVAGTSTVLASYSAAPTAGEGHTVIVTAKGTTISATIDGVQPTGWSVTDSSVTAAGSIALFTTGATGSTNTTGIHFDNLQAVAA